MTITAELPPLCLVCGRQLPPQRPPYPPTCTAHETRNWTHPGWRHPGPIEVAVMKEQAHEDARKAVAG